MKSYKPTTVPDDAKALPDYLRRETTAIQQAANRNDQYLGLDWISVSPDRPQSGLYLARATVLGATAGLYRYDPISATYTFIG